MLTKTIAAIRKEEKYAEKSKILYILLLQFSNKKAKLSPEDKKELSDFVFEEIERLTLLIPTITSYKEKDFLFEYKYHLQNAIMLCFRNADELSEDQRRSVDTLFELVNKETFLENMVDEIFANKKYDADTVNYMLAMTALAKDEYHKGKLYQGLLHYQRDILRLPEDIRDLIGAHMESEMKRYLDHPLTTDTEANLELICDVCRYFRKERFIEPLQKSLWLGNAHIRFYAFATLLTFGCDPSARIIETLANDIEYAKLTYDLLKRYRKESLFPAELATPEYLAQSDLTRWLLYPTELGQAPDEIEYIGRVRKKGIFYIFRFRSNSENLDEESRGRWLIGWSGSKGGTFSNFDLYENYKQITTDKTLKYIKKNLL
jgi:hypothetical protein